MAEEFFLGDLTAAVQDADLAEAGDAGPGRTFTLFGEKFRLAARPDAAAVLLHAKAATDGTDDTSMEGVAANCRYIEACFSEAEAQRFWAVLHRNRVGAPGYTVLVHKLMEAFSGNPTKPSTDSVTTSGTTSRGSKGGSSKKARSAPTTVDSSAA